LLQLEIFDLAALNAGLGGVRGTKPVQLVARVPRFVPAGSEIPGERAPATCACFHGHATRSITL